MIFPFDFQHCQICNSLDWFWIFLPPWPSRRGLQSPEMKREELYYCTCNLVANKSFWRGRSLALLLPKRCVGSVPFDMLMAEITGPHLRIGWTHLTKPCSKATKKSWGLVLHSLLALDCFTTCVKMRCRQKPNECKHALSRIGMEVKAPEFWYWLLDIILKFILLAVNVK